MNGTNTLNRQNDFYVSRNGMWLYIGDCEYFIPFSDYPVLQRHTIEELSNYIIDNLGNIHWAELDIDIEKNSLDNPKKFLLIYD